MERALVDNNEKEYILNHMPEMVDYCRFADPTWGLTPPKFWVIYFNEKFSLSRFITKLNLSA